VSDAADELLEPPPVPRPHGRWPGRTSKGVPDVRYDDFDHKIPKNLISGPQLGARLGVVVTEVQEAIDAGRIPRQGRWFDWRAVKKELRRQLEAGEVTPFSTISTFEDLID